MVVWRMMLEKYLDGTRAKGKKKLEKPSIPIRDRASLDGTG